MLRDCIISDHRSGPPGMKEASPVKLADPGAGFSGGIMFEVADLCCGEGAAE